jgi:murein L,D-transpeptidase YafK
MRRLTALALLLPVVLFVGGEDYSANASSELKITGASGRQDGRILLDERYNYRPEDLERFLAMIEQTVRGTIAGNNHAIIIDKAEYKLFLIKNGAVLSSYHVELGRNPFDDKRMEGDSCTPEGFYRVTWKRDIGNTVFYRALFLDYPNREDRERFRQRVESGELPSSAGIGGSIEIHGCGSGKPGNAGGWNWTLGCIALSNEDMDELFEAAPLLCPVTIVRYGSDRSPLLARE